MSVCCDHIAHTMLNNGVTIGNQNAIISRALQSVFIGSALYVPTGDAPPSHVGPKGGAASCLRSSPSSHGRPSPSTMRDQAPLGS